MKNNKTAIIVIIILILIMIIQLIYFNNKTKKNGSETNTIILNNTSYQTTSQKMNIKNMVELMKKYDGQLSQTDIESLLYNTINTNIYTIKDIVNNKNVNEIQQYYDNNTEQINNLGIYSKDEFVIITEEIKNTFREKYVILRSAEIELNENNNNIKDDYYKFKLVISYTNGTKINLKCEIAKNKEDRIKLILSSYSEIAQIYERYKGTTDKNEFINTLDEFIDSMKTIHDDTKLKSLNYQSQYYQLNLSKLNNIGIQSEKDFKSVAFEINTNISWIEQINFSYYTIKLDTYKETDGYANFKINFNFEQTEQFELNVGLALNKSIPSIKINGQNGEL
ncbi:MAG: hypothetical protein IKG14_00870 [Clostridia bacterium]|nr:hypothetical protein [Clostridia bacterium]MBR3324588.1 hypothetical protein [Clostridia bacterium]